MPRARKKILNCLIFWLNLGKSSFTLSKQELLVFKIAIYWPMFKREGSFHPWVSATWLQDCGKNAFI